MESRMVLFLTHWILSVVRILRLSFIFTNEGLHDGRAIQRQLAHYPYPLVQMIYIAKELKRKVHGRVYHCEESK